MTTETTDTPPAVPAVGAQVQRGVRPIAWRSVGGSIWGHKTSEDDEPLYGADQLTAEFDRGHAVGVAAERGRWIEAVMAELDGNGQAHAIVAYATRA